MLRQLAINRREFLKTAGLGLLGLAALPLIKALPIDEKPEPMLQMGRDGLWHQMPEPIDYGELKPPLSVVAMSLSDSIKTKEDANRRASEMLDRMVNDSKIYYGWVYDEG